MTSPSSTVRVGTNLPPTPAVTPCGQYVGEVLVDTAGVYVGDMTGPSYSSAVLSGFAFGMKVAQGYGYECCGGVFWLHSGYWWPPWILDECGGGGTRIPISAAWRGGIIPELVLDAQAPPELAGMKALHFVGTGIGEVGVTAFRPLHDPPPPGEPTHLTDYWYPAQGSQWVWEGWIRCDGGAGPEDDVVGTPFYVGYAANNIGYRGVLAGNVGVLYQHFRIVFTVEDLWGADTGPHLPVLYLVGPKLKLNETRQVWWPPEEGGCGPLDDDSQQLTLTKAKPKGGFYLMCCHVYPYQALPLQPVTIDRRFGLEQ